MDGLTESDTSAAAPVSRPPPPLDTSSRGGGGAWPALARTLRPALDPLLSRSLVSAVVVVLGLRIALGLVGWASIQVWPITSVGGDHLELLISDRTRAWPTLGPWQRYDALWYQHLATSGYTDPQTDTAFYPLYPGLVHLVGSLIGGSYVLAGLLVTTLAAIAGLALLHRLVTEDADVPTADRALLYCAIAPAAFFLLAPFTEGLFLALSVGAFLAARRRHFVTAGILGGLAGVTRVVGALLVAPLLVEAAADAWERRRAGQPALRLAHVAVFLPVASFLAWNAWLVLHVGVAGGSFGPAERVWGTHLAAPWTALRESIDSLVHHGHVEEALNLGAALALAVTTPVMLGRLPLSYAVYSALSFAVVACRENFVTPLESAARFATVAFPVFVLCALAGRRLWVDRLVVTVFPVVMTAAFVGYVHFVFVG